MWVWQVTFTKSSNRFHASVKGTSVSFSKWPLDSKADGTSTELERSIHWGIALSWLEAFSYFSLIVLWLKRMKQYSASALCFVIFPLSCRSKGAHATIVCTCVYLFLKILILRYLFCKKIASSYRLYMYTVHSHYNVMCRWTIICSALTKNHTLL